MKYLSILIALICYVGIYIAPKEETVLSIGTFIFFAAYMIMDNNDDNAKEIIKSITKPNPDATKS